MADLPLDDATQATYTPPGTMQSVDTMELNRWALEAAMARGVPLEPDTMSWRRKLHSPPSWVLPPSSRNPATRNLSAQKRSYWKRKPYARTLRVRYNEFGPFEFSTVNPRTGLQTNSWHLDELHEVLTEGSSIYLAFPGSWVAAKTYIEVSTASPRHAALLVAEWGWEPISPPSVEQQQHGEALPEGTEGPPVLTNDGQTFVFRH